MEPPPSARRIRLLYCRCGSAAIDWRPALRVPRPPPHLASLVRDYWGSAPPPAGFSSCPHPAGASSQVRHCARVAESRSRAQLFYCRFSRLIPLLIIPSPASPGPRRRVPKGWAPAQCRLRRSRSRTCGIPGQRCYEAWFSPAHPYRKHPLSPLLDRTSHISPQGHGLPAFTTSHGIREEFRKIALRVDQFFGKGSDPGVGPAKAVEER